MVIKIFHTADLHLGMRFAGYAEVQNELIDARFETLANMVKMANQEECHLFVIAGDLFDRVTVGAKDISRAALALNEFNGELVIILPGNHDYYESDSKLWGNFSGLAGDRVLILKEPRMYDLRTYHLDALVFGCPCSSKHSAKNAVGWITPELLSEKDLIKIGIAHGSLEGVSPDFNQTYYPMSSSELGTKGLDLWLLGHTHLPWPDIFEEGSKIFIPGTPEPDGIDCKHEGNAYIFTIESPSEKMVQRVATGKNRFLIKEITLQDENSIQKVLAEFNKKEYENTILRLILRGRLKKEDFEKVKEALQIIEERVLFLQVIEDELGEEIILELINSEFTEGSFPYQLLTSLLESNEEQAPKALQKAYDLIREIQDEN